MSGIHSSPTPQSQASATSCSSIVTEQSFKKRAKYMEEIERQISEMRAACALVAAAELEEETIQALSESTELEGNLEDAFNNFKISSNLLGLEQITETSSEEQEELDLRLKTLRDLNESLKALRAKAILTKVSLTGDSELNATLDDECDHAAANFRSEDVIDNTAEVIRQVLEINELYEEISGMTTKFEYLNELEDSLHVYLESLVISADLIDFPN